MTSKKLNYHINSDQPENYQICNKCVMDTTDPKIVFDENGICDHCLNFSQNLQPKWHANINSDNSLDKLAQEIRSRRSKGNDFDCIIGLSGGLDSSYVAHVAVHKMGLRPLLVHVDAGWNTDQAVSNIEKLVDGLQLDLFTHVVNWQAVKELQLAFFRSGIPDQDLVQDAAFFSALYQFARKYRIRDVITGSNYSTECCREPEAWGGYLGIDRLLFKDIWSKFGTKSDFPDFPITDILVYKFWYQGVLGMRIHHPLNLTNYIKNDAEQELHSCYGWKPFQHKHHESRFTRFYEDYWLPRRFGYEKRRAHLSSLVMTDQTTRANAIERLLRPEMDERFLEKEFTYVASKLEISEQELQHIFESEKRTFSDFKNKRNTIKLGARLATHLTGERRNLK
jgi:putative aminotransferase